MKDYRTLSLWHDGLPEPIVPRPQLEGPQAVDVAIVGAGYTGLWAAYYLAKADPHLRIAVLEKEVAGFGASGRNGGWCSSFFPASWDTIARARDREGERDRGREAAVALQRAMFETVDEVGRVAAEEGIDARFHKGGALTLAMNQAQLTRLREELDEQRAWGFGEEDYAWLDAGEARRRVHVDGALGAHYAPHCAALDPARLARGLADTVERLGVKLYEQTPVLALGGRYAQTPNGAVAADVVVRATEGYTPELPQYHRELVPLYSLMIATEPLPDAMWERLGWAGRECLGDGRHLIIYAQRTADGRIAMGGRGAPYHFRSRVRDAFDRDQRIFSRVEASLLGLFPFLRATRITHRWGGPIGVPRDWYSSVGYDMASGYAWAGGYVGDGVGTSNLAGRTLADLVLGRDTDLIRLPWVNRRPRPWEPEPLRWVAVNGALRLMDLADAQERRTGRPSRLGTAIDTLIGA